MMCEVGTHRYPYVYFLVHGDRPVGEDQGIQEMLRPRGAPAVRGYAHVRAVD